MSEVVNAQATSAVSKPDGLNQLVRDIYNKENPEKAKRLTDDIVNNIVTTYGNDYKQIVQKIYEKENPEKAKRLNDDVYSNISKSYGFDAPEPADTPPVPETQQEPTYITKQLMDKGLLPKEGTPEGYSPVAKEQTQTISPVQSLHSSIPYVHIDTNDQSKNQVIQSVPAAKTDMSFNPNTAPKVGDESKVENVIPQSKTPEQQYFDPAIKNTGGATINSNQPEEKPKFTQHPVDYMGSQIEDFLKSTVHTGEQAGAEIAKSVLNNVRYANPTLPGIWQSTYSGEKILDDWKNSIPKDNDSAGSKAGQIVPFVGLALATIFQPELAPATTATFFSMGQGEGLYHADEIEKQSGKVMPDLKKQLYGVGYGAAYTALTAATDHLIPESVSKYMTNAFFKNSPELISGLEKSLQSFADKTPAGLNKAVDLGAQYLSGVGKSALGMEAMDLGKLGTNKAMGENVGINDILNGIKQSVSSGAMFESVLFPFSKYKQIKSINQRREAQGTVAINIIDGKPFEIYQSGDEYFAVRPNGTIEKATAEDYNNSLIIPTDVFNKTLETGKVSPTIQRDVYAGRLADMLNRVSDKEGNVHTHTDSDGNLFYVLGKDADGNYKAVDKNGQAGILDGNSEVKSINKGEIYSSLLSKYDQEKKQQTPVTTAIVNGQQVTINNPEDLGQDGKPIFAKDAYGNVIHIPNHKVENPVTKTVEQIEQEADKAKLYQGIADPNAEITDDIVKEDIRLVRFSNGQSKIITPKGEVVTNNQQEEDRILEAAVKGEPIQAQAPQVQNPPVSTEPSYPLDKDGKPDVDNMTDEQFFAYKEAKSGKDAAISALTQDVQNHTEDVDNLKQKIAKERDVRKKDKLEDQLAELESKLAAKQALLESKVPKNENISQQQPENVSVNNSQLANQQAVENTPQAESLQNNQLQNEESKKVDQQPDGIIANEGENTPQAQQGQGNKKRLEENVNEIKAGNPESREELELRLQEERKQRILSEGTSFDREFNLIHPKDIKSADDVISNVNKIITTLKENEGNGKFRSFEGFASNGNYSKNAGDQIREYFIALDVLPNELRNDMRKAFSDNLKINNVQELMDWAAKQYKQTASAVPPVVGESFTPGDSANPVVKENLSTEPEQDGQDSGQRPAEQNSVIINAGNYAIGLEKDNNGQWQNSDVGNSEYSLWRRPDSNTVYVYPNTGEIYYQVDENGNVSELSEKEFRVIDEQIAKGQNQAGNKDQVHGQGNEAVGGNENPVERNSGSESQKELTPLENTPELKPIRQLGTGSNVYYETSKYRVNDDLKNGGVLLNIHNNSNDATPIANYHFNTPEEAVKIAEKLNSVYPDGVPEALLLDKYIESLQEPKFRLADKPYIQQTIDYLQSLDDSPKQIVVGSKEEIIQHLKDNGYPQSTINVVKNTNFGAVIIGGKIFMDLGNIDTPESAIINWLHERTHAETSGELTPKELIDLYKSLGTREIRRIIPSFYWDMSYEAQADEYISYAAEQLISTGQLDDLIPEHAKEIITNIVNQFTSPKILQDAKRQSNNLDNIRQGNTSRNVHGSNTDTRGTGETERNSEGEQNPSARSGLSENERRNENQSGLANEHTDSNTGGNPSLRRTESDNTSGSTGKTGNEPKNQDQVHIEQRGLTISDQAKEDLKTRHNALDAITRIGTELNTPIQVVNSSEVQSGDNQLVFTDNGTVNIVSDRVKSVSDVIKSLVKEVATTKGLREMFAQADPSSIIGKQLAKFDELADNEMESDKMAQIIRKAFRLTSNQFTNDDLREIVSRSRKQEARFRAEDQSQIVQDARKYNSFEDFVDAYKDADFRDSHSAPRFDDTPTDQKLDSGGDFSLVEVANGFHNQPSDYFAPRIGARYYGYDDTEGMQSYTAISNIIRAIKAGNNDRTITAYRAVPKELKVNKLIDGDWVTFSKEYAIGHGESRFGEKEYKIIKQEVNPKDLWWDGNDINEWGYDTGKTQSLGRSDLKKIWDEVHGEVESRNVQTRMNMTPEERLNTLLSETEDVAREDQIVLMDGLGVNDLRSKITHASSEVNTEPSDAQKEANNYKHGHIRFDGFDISIENPKGSVRSGVDKQGNEWSQVLPADYGYFRGTVGKDKDHVDVFIGPKPEVSNIYIIDQIDPQTGKFDEHKVMLGFDSRAKAKQTYLAAFEKGWGGLAQITKTDKQGLKEWFEKGDQKKPFSDNTETRFRIVPRDETMDQLREDLSKITSLARSAERLKELEESKIGKKVAERQAIIKQISGYKQGYKAGANEKRFTLYVIQRYITKYANENINYDEATKGEIQQLLTAMQNANTPAKIAKAFERIDELASKGIKRKLINKIAKLLKNIAPKLQSGKPVGNISPEAYQALNKIQKIIEMSPEEYDQYLEEIPDGDVESMALASMFGNLKEKSIDNLFEALKSATSIKKDGKLWYKEKIDELKKKHEKLINKAVDDITGGKGIQSSQQIRSDKGIVDKNSSFKEYLSKNLSFEWLLDLISNNKKDRTGYGFMQDHFGDLVNKSENEESKGIRDTLELINEKAFEIFGKEKSALAKIFSKNSKVVKKSGVTYATNDGRKEIPLSQNEAYKRWMEMNDPTLTPTFEKMGWDAQSLEELEKFIDPKVMKWAQWQINEFFPKYYERVNNIYKEMYFADLPFNPNYSGYLKREKTSVGDKEDSMLRPSTLIQSVANSSLKSRIKNTRDIMLQDGDSALARHIAEMEHFIAWAESIREIRAVLSSDAVQDAIKKEHGNNIRTVLNERINSLVRGGVDRGEVNYLVDWIRKNYVTSALGINVSLTPKQMTAMFSYLNDISIMDYIKGASEFIANPTKAIEALNDSEFIRRRYEKGWTHEIVAAMKRDNPNTLAGTKSKVNAVRDALMLPIMLGDKFAVYSGYPVYSKFFKEYKANNPLSTDKEAHDFAINKFERVAKRTQQSSDVTDTSRFQETSLGKVFMMFKNQQQQYFRYEMAAINSLLKGKGSKAENAKIILLTHVVLPVIFQMVANWFTDEDDDKERLRLLRAALLGPLDGLMIAGDIIGYGLERLMGEKWSYSASPMFDTVQDLGSSIDNVIKYLNEPYPEKEAEDLQKALDFTLQFTSSTMTGVPYEPAKRIYNKITGEEKNKIIEEQASEIIRNADEFKKFVKEAAKRNDREAYDLFTKDKNITSSVSIISKYDSRIQKLKKALKHYEFIKDKKTVDELEKLLDQTYKELIEKYKNIHFPEYKLNK